MLSRYSRLRGTLQSYRQELEGRLATAVVNESQSPYVHMAVAMLREAEEFLEKNQIDEAWKCLFAAQRAEIPSLDKNEVEIKAAVLRREAEKLSSWRRHRIGRDSSDFTEFLRRKRSLQCHIQSGRS
ncbi:MAG TPA: hypothetical protein VJ044_14250 [Candidatus Hodarchaeales archaeon]|nr:hypothetical protein [Candidatus Hodarchaeales archaeon]